MTLVLTNTNTDALMKISEGNLDVLEELAVDWKKSLSKNTSAPKSKRRP